MQQQCNQSDWPTRLAATMDPQNAGSTHSLFASASTVVPSQGSSPKKRCLQCQQRVAALSQLFRTLGRLMPQLAVPVLRLHTGRLFTSTRSVPSCDSRGATPPPSVSTTVTRHGKGHRAVPTYIVRLCGCLRGCLAWLYGSL